MKALSIPRTRLMTKQFALVWSLTFVTFFAAFQLFPTVPLRLRELGASLGESGRFMSLFTAGSAFGALFTGPLGAREQCAKGASGGEQAHEAPAFPQARAQLPQAQRDRGKELEGRKKSDEGE